ncbi:MAG: hypothetical protein WC006_07635 [Bacilli bacterium]|nr:hypothetical protein [Bacilli bacterium]
MKKIIYRPFILTLIMILSLVTVLQFSYGYFDSLSGSKSSTINIGDWHNNQPTPNDVVDYVENIKFPEDEDMAEYILDILGDYEDGEFVIDEVYEDYTMSEIIEIIELINEFTESFLETENGEIVFKDIIVEPVEVTSVANFSPGDVQYIKQVIQTAEFATDPWWTPITFQLQLSADPGIDITDFSVEILFDLNPFTVTTPFAYDFKVNDPNRDHYKTIIQTDIGSNQTSNLPAIGTISYINRAFNVTQNQFLRFKHEYNAPSITGEWRRFPIGPNMYFNSPTTGGQWSGSRQQFYTENEPTKVAGMTLSGRNDGGMVEMLFSFNARKPRNSNSLPVIPIVIVISRAVEVDANGNDLPNQRTDLISPEIKLRVVKGNIYNNNL